MRRISLIATGALLSVPLATGIAHAQEPGIADMISVSVSCASRPESVTVLNLSDHTIGILGLTSLHATADREPVVLDQWLVPGGSFTHESGRPGVPNDLPMFQNWLPGEGVRVMTTEGTVMAYCSSGVGSLVLGESVVAPVVNGSAVEPAGAPDDVSGSAGIVGTTGASLTPMTTESDVEAAAGGSTWPEPSTEPWDRPVDSAVLGVMAVANTGRTIGVDSLMIPDPRGGRMIRAGGPVPSAVLGATAGNPGGTIVWDPYAMPAPGGRVMLPAED